MTPAERDLLILTARLVCNRSGAQWGDVSSLIQCVSIEAREVEAAGGASAPPPVPPLLLWCPRCVAYMPPESGFDCGHRENCKLTKMPG